MSATKSSTAKVPHLTIDQRMARGKAARAEVPRSSHAAFEPSDDRPDPLALLEEQAADRVPGLVPIRYGRMLVSPFTFYRGAALIMAASCSRPGGFARYSMTTGSMPALRIRASVFRDVPQEGL